MRCLGSDMNMVCLKNITDVLHPYISFHLKTFEALLDDQSSVIIRQRRTHTVSSSDLWSSAKFEAEVALLLWLSSNSDIPVPQVLYIGRDESASHGNFMVISKLPGITLSRQYGVQILFNQKTSLKVNIPASLEAGTLKGHPSFLSLCLIQC